tara:strand:- start:3303 stop:3539 length:237 start_codon:yes stop_codon:yes gene_type:complete
MNYPMQLSDSKNLRQYQKIYDRNQQVMQSMPQALRRKDPVMQAEFEKKKVEQQFVKNQINSLQKNQSQMQIQNNFAIL